MSQKTPLPTPADAFAQYRLPHNLRAGGAGSLCFATRRASLDENRNLSRLWLLRDGRLCQLLGEDAPFSGYWWAGEHSLVVAGPGAQPGPAGDGQPFTRLELLDVRTPAAPTLLANLPLQVEDVLPLPAKNAYLLLARWNGAARPIPEGGGSSAERGAATEETQVCQVFDEFPPWAEGEGAISGWRRRLFLLQNGAVTPLTDEQTEVLAVRLFPSGRRACLIAKPRSHILPVADRLCILNLDTLTLRDITFAEPFRHDAAVPLDENSLLVAGSTMAAHGLHQNPAFYRVSAETGEAATLYAGGAYSAECSISTDMGPAAEALWQADGGQVWFVSTQGQSVHLMKIDANTGRICQVSRRPGAVLELARTGGATAAVALRGNAGPELMRIDDDGGESVLTDFNTGLSARFAAAPRQRLGIQNSRGHRVEGFVLRPPGLGKNQRCPAILYLHGGPKFVYGPVLFHEMAYLAAQGYALLLCNPTGSDGGGDDFADLRGQWGGQDAADALQFLNAALAAHPFIDPARLGLAGGSYGGFLVNCLLGRTSRFSAAVSQRGISNFSTMAALSDIGYFLVPDQLAIGPSFVREADALWQASPLKAAGQITTPTLFIHGTHDRRCPPEESLQLFSALRQNGVPARLCLFEGENHALALSGAPAARLRRLREITNWFARYLPVAARPPGAIGAAGRGSG